MKRENIILITWVVAGLIAFGIDRLRKTEKLNIPIIRCVFFGYISLVIVLFLPLITNDANEFEDRLY
jgi:hypothetical protein